MPYIVVKNEDAVLSRVSPDALLTWEPWKGSGSPPVGAITFETFSGADKCARMQGGKVGLIDYWGSLVANVAEYGPLDYRMEHRRPVSGLVGVE